MADRDKVDMVADMDMADMDMAADMDKDYNIHMDNMTYSIISY
jgi:hypothetical protein